MKQGYWVIRSYKAGAVGEKIKYWVPGEKPTKSARRMKSDIKQQQRNEANSEKRLARAIHANFTSRDLLLTGTYSDEGLDRIGRGLDLNELYHAAHHQLRLWLKRTRNACRAAGVTFRYLAITSDLDGKTGEVVRVHHHIIVNAEAAEIAAEKWKLGQTHSRHLYDVVDQTALAAYLVRQARRLPDEKRYIPSRNLTIPEPKDRIAVSGAELVVPKGGQLLHRAGWTPGMPQYIRYILPEVGKIRREQKKAAASASSE